MRLLLVSYSATQACVPCPLNVFVSLTFEVWTQVKVTVHHLNKDNICTKL